MRAWDSLGASGADPGRGSFAGIDWGETWHQLCVVDADGVIVLQARYGHDVAGLAGLGKALAGAGPLAGIAIERAEGLLVEHLHQHGHRLFCVSPKVSARARERYRMAPAKSDAFDAFVLADTLRHEHRHWRPLPVPSPLLLELRVLSRDRDRLVASQRDAENRLRSALLAYHPAVLHVFSSLDRDISLAFLRDYPTPGHAARVGVARMDRFCGRHGYSGRTRPEVLVERMQAHLLEASAGTVAGKAYTAMMFVDQLDLLNRQVRAVTGRLAERLAEHPDAGLFLAFPGMGTVTAATMLTEMGEDRARFPTADALLAETGTAPVTRSSGRHRSVHFRYAANARMRHAITWWSFVSTREDEWAHAAYQQARARGQLHSRALRGIGARWVRVLWRCWTDHATYDPERHASRQPAPAA